MKSARAVLSKERIVEAAALVADRGGIAAVSMRSVAAELGVEAMSLYHHVASKSALLDSLADWASAFCRPGTSWAAPNGFWPRGTPAPACSSPGPG